MSEEEDFNGADATHRPIRLCDQRNERYANRSMTPSSVFFCLSAAHREKIDRRRSNSDDMVPDPDADRGCPKCGQTETEGGTISTTGGGLSEVFDIQTTSFKVVPCTNCGYCELYRDTTSGTSDIVDVFLG